MISVKYPGGDEGLKKEFGKNCIAAFKLGVLGNSTRSYLIGRHLLTLSAVELRHFSKRTTGG